MIFILRDQSIVDRLTAFLAEKWAKTAAKAPLVVEIHAMTSSRTGQQNRWYWSCLADLAEDGWYHGQQFSKDAWHEFMRGLFLYRVELPDGSTAPVSTTRLTVPEFMEYLERINLWASENLGIPFFKAEHGVVFDAKERII